MRVMAVDYGEVRTGVALSDLTGTLTGEAFTIETPGRKALVARLSEMCSEKSVSRIVLGYPKHMNGEAGERALLSERLAGELENKTGLPVTLWDERLTSVDAGRILSENGRRGKGKKARIDAVAASLILEGFLSSL